MTASNQNFNLYRGDDLDVLINVSHANAGPVNLSSAQEVRWELLRNGSHQEVILMKTEGDGLTVEGSVARATITGAESTTLLASAYHHRLIVEDANGKKYTVTTGNVRAR